MRSRRIRILACSMLLVCGVPVLAHADAGPPADSPSTEQLNAQALEPASKPAPESLPLGASSAAKPTGAEAAAETRSSTTLGLSRTLGALMGVVGLAFACAIAWRWIAQKRGGLIASLGAAGRAPSGVIEVLARYPVARSQRLVLLRVGRRVVLTCQSSSVRGGAGAMNTLAEFTDADEVASLLCAVRETDRSTNETDFRVALRELERADAGQPLSTKIEFSSRAGDTVQFSDPRIQIPRQSAPTSPIDPAIGQLRSRLAAMRAKGDAA